MSWILGTSLVVNLILLVAWLKERSESSDWKNLARTGFEHLANERTPTTMTPSPRCGYCGARHLARECPMIRADRYIN
jgi:hypothetical protein